MMPVTGVVQQSTEHLLRTQLAKKKIIRNLNLIKHLGVAIICRK